MQSKIEASTPDLWSGQNVRALRRIAKLKRAQRPLLSRIDSLIEEIQDLYMKLGRTASGKRRLRQ